MHVFSACHYFSMMATLYYILYSYTTLPHQYYTRILLLIYYIYRYLIRVQQRLQHLHPEAGLHRPEVHQRGLVSNML